LESAGQKKRLLYFYNSPKESYPGSESVLVSFDLNSIKE